jgi:sigma-B regulation protein RsbU (phosphoserine phosphatase)
MRALIADDQPDVIEALQLLLKQEGYQTESAASPPALLESLSQKHFDLLLMDMNYTRDTTSGQEGLELLARIRQLRVDLPIVVMTAWGSIPLAVEAMRRGAGDFVLKPWDNGELLSTLRKQIEDTAKTRADLQDAAATQQALLPRQIPQIAGCTIAAAWTPAHAVGGDYMDLIPLGEDRLAIAIGDVSGKGMPAALLMSNLQAAVRALATGQRAAKEITARLNQIICANTTSNKFITFFYGLLENRCLTYTNAGHNAPILVRASGEAHRFDRGGAVLGVFPEWTYEEGRVELAPGDRLLLFSDGISEAEDATGTQFSEDRLLELVREHRALAGPAIKEKLLCAVADFAAGPWQDDSTLLVIAVD